MKKFIRIMLAMKERAALCHSAAMCYCLLFLFCLGQREASLSLLFSLLLASVAAGVLQVLAFTELILKKLSYGGRMAVFVLPYFLILTAIAALFHWFPMEYGGAWLLFVLFFILIFLLLTAGFELYYRLSGRRYDGLLGQYRQKKGR